MDFLEAILAALIATVIATLLTDELRALLPWLTQRTLQLAIRIVPAAYRDRFHEEWAAHLDDTPGSYTKLGVAIGFILAACRFSYGEICIEAGSRILAAIILAYMAPLMLFLFLVKKADSQDSAVGRTSCLGKNATIFTLYRYNINKKSSIDIFLFRTGAYRIPELWNIVAGDMSFVGPRPRIAQEINDLEKRVRECLAIKPGLISWADVNAEAWHSKDQELDFDLWYIRNRNLWLDIQIITRAVIGRNASS